MRLALDPRSAPLRTRALEDKLAQALARYFGTPVRLRDRAARERAGDAGALESSARRPSGVRRRASQFEADPTVEALKQRFGASVLPDTVRPAEPER